MPRISSGSGIYCFKNLVNEKVYIGQAVHLERRIGEHWYYLKLGKDKSIALQRAIDKYGIDNFESFIVERCDASELNDREIFYISNFKSNNKKYGYNIAAGGNSGLIGYKWPKEFGEKISKAKKGWVMSEEQKKRISEFQKGKIVSDETRKRMSIANTKEKHPMWGKKHSEEARAKMREKKGAEKSYQFGTKTTSATSQYYGVCRMISKGHTYWIAYVKVKGVRNHLGSSKIEEDAARMYDAYVIENGLPNPLNFSI